MYAGVDEAGRGPVIGPLVVAGVAGERDQAPDAVRDSKQLSPERRESLAEQIRASGLQVAVREVSADELNERMSAGEDLNTIEADAFATVLAELEAPRAVTDAIGTEDAALADELAAQVASLEDVDARAGADASDPLVGAASIVAKVRRDQAVEAIADELGTEIGSGYPSDPTTRSFLEDWRETSIDPPPHTRTAWSTLEDLGFGQPRLDELAAGDATSSQPGEPTP